MDPELVAAYALPDADRPYVRANFVSSADGAVTVDGHAGPLSGPADKRLLHTLRLLCDVLLVGAGTVRVEGYGSLGIDEAAQEWRVSQGLSPHPVFAIVSNSLDLGTFVPSMPVRPLVLTHEGADGSHLADVADVVPAGVNAVSLPDVLAELASRGLTQVLCEGGPTLFGEMVALDLVDELCLTLSPQLIGSGPGRIVDGPPSQLRRLSLAGILVRDDEVFLRYRRA